MALTNAQSLLLRTIGPGGFQNVWGFAPIESGPDFNPIQSIYSGIADVLGAPPVPDPEMGFQLPNLEPLIPPILRGQGGQFEPQIETGITAAAGSVCWTNPRYAARRRVRVVRIPDPSAPGGFRLQAVQTCAPRRMNPLNPRALSRAGRRVGSFCRIATGMQKMLAAAVGGSCKPKRRGFRIPTGRRSHRGCR